MTTSHEWSAEDVMAVIDGESADRRDDGAVAHIRSCAQCQAVSRDVHDVSALLQEWTVAPAPDRFVAPPGHARRPSLRPAAKLTLVAAACALLFFFVNLPWLDRPQPASAPSVQPTSPLPGAGFAAAWGRQPRIDLGIQGGGARVLVVAFIDWLCRPCHGWRQAYAPVLSRYERDHPGDVTLIVRDWPWNKRCNLRAPTFQGHDGSCAAALAVRIARDQGKAEAMIAWLFENFERLTSMTEEQAAEAIAQALRRLLGILDVDAAIAAARPALDQEIADNARFEISGTPTYFINGVRIPTDQQLPPAQLDEAIALELKRAGALPSGR